MTQNPYAPPSAAPGPMNRPRPSASGTIDIGDALSEAWRTMTEQWVVGIFGYLLASILTMISFITCIGILLLAPIFAWGYTALVLNMIDGDAEIGDLFSGFNRYGEVLASMLVYYFLIFLLSVPQLVIDAVGRSADLPALSMLSIFVGFAISLFVTIRLYLAPYYIVDQGMGAVEAMKAAWEATSEQKVTIILLSLVSGLVALSGFFIVLIGMFFTLPLATLVWVAAYRQLEPVHNTSEAAPPPAYAPAPM